MPLQKTAAQTHTFKNNSTLVVKEQPMELPNMSLLSITPIYIALLGILFVPITMRVGLYRVKNKIDLGDGNDDALFKLNRGQGNFVETVPLAVVLLLLMELLGAGTTWLHTLGALLVVGRFLHYVGITEVGPGIGRPIGMFATFGVYAAASFWILFDVLG
tara:strand:+ start:1219 stop:1698 length:480 start_codon:yes stop_codon:yes gene_type:complete